MNIKELIKKDFAVHCKTEEEAKSLFAALSIYGFTWKSGVRLSFNQLKFESFKERTVYVFDVANKKVTYNDITVKDYYEFSEINLCNSLCNNNFNNYSVFYTLTYNGDYCTVDYGVPKIVEVPILFKTKSELKKIKLRPEFEYALIIKDVKIKI